MASARTILATMGFLQLLAVVLNFWSPLLFYMLPVAILASLILWISVYYNWKRGVELFIFLCIVLFIMALCPLISVLVHRQAAEKWHDVMWYCIEMTIEAFSIAASIWVLYHTDYTPKKEKEGLLSRAQNYVRESSGMSFSSAATPKVDHSYDEEGRRTDSGFMSRFPSVGRSSKSPAAPV